MAGQPPPLVTFFTALASLLDWGFDYKARHGSHAYNPGTMTPGTRIGPYVVSDTLGAGGMGEVYRARDSKLQREVAVKVLPEAFAADAERLARFEREARMLASLNHPNIAHVYGLEEAEGSQALVMELVDGPTLA